ncbi:MULTISPECIES: hypothetical protein [unclassified Ensifer]|uniref:hypothetical protein n=1 Tax=unclassified Ensifer TaxID=2633371 RepID=UPI0008132382|nr:MULTISPECIES: hypothetical protein [unclassified Ensifer]OCP17804.1 hypothetical protein BC361_10375 [Ensifer sp. LC54]OCP17891.1 hypothetical protein BC363_32955 [Ensifer sp. LC384]
MRYGLLNALRVVISLAASFAVSRYYFCPRLVPSLTLLCYLILFYGSSFVARPKATVFNRIGFISAGALAAALLFIVYHVTYRAVVQNAPLPFMQGDVVTEFLYAMATLLGLAWGPHYWIFVLVYMGLEYSLMKNAKVAPATEAIV